MTWATVTKCLWYYCKPVSPKLVIDAQSAMPFKDRRTVLTQDLLRVLLRCSPELPWSEKKKHVEEYVLRMQFSGYEEKVRKEIVRSAISAYEKIRKKVEMKERPLYRTKMWKQKERQKEKRKKKSNWYKRNKGGNKKNENDRKEYKSVLFVQPTRDSVLKRKYEEVIAKSKCSVKVVERAGRSVRQKLQKSYPFRKDKCAVNDCFVCLSGGKGNCLRDNINYEIECTRIGCEYVYYGESARNSYCRGREHLKSLSKRDPESVLVEHVNTKHDGVYCENICCEFRMSVKETHSNAMERQITEATKIDLSDKKTMNRKAGYRANSVLRLRSSLTADNTPVRT